jgi:hypothetical protein
MVERFKKDYMEINPQSVNDVGKAYIDNILEYGADSWYDWCIDNWGTKWNATEGTIGENYLEFETAWDPPFPVIMELSRRFPELIFNHEWADENLGYNCGWRSFRNGSVLDADAFEDDDEAHEFACTLWGYGPDDV